MYEIKSEPETLCHGCLSAGRKLSYLSNYDLYWSLLKEDQRLQEFITPEVAMCWECSAMLRRMQVFQARVQRAQAVLQDRAVSSLITSPLSTLTFNLKKEYDAIFQENLEEKYGFDTFTKDETKSVEKELNLTLDLKEEEEYLEKLDSLHNDSDHHSFDDDFNDGNLDDISAENSLDTPNTTRRSERQAAKICKLKITNTKQQVKGVYASIKALSKDLQFQQAKKQARKRKLTSPNNEEKESVIILQFESEHVTSTDPVIHKLKEELTRIINKKNATRKFLHSKGKRIKRRDIYDGSSDDSSGEDTDDLDNSEWDPENIYKSAYDKYTKEIQKKKKSDSDPEFEIDSDSDADADSDIDKSKKKKVDNETEITEGDKPKRKKYPRKIYKRLIIRYDNIVDVLPYFMEVEMCEDEIWRALEAEDAIVHGNLKYRCDECGRYFAYRRIVDNHKLREHNKNTRPSALPPSPPRSLWRCSLCPRPRLLRRHHIVTHMNDHHRIQFICIEPECQWSSKVFWCREDFEAHWDSCHKLLTCDYCGRQTRFKRFIIHHIQKKHSPRPLAPPPCPTCGLVLPSRRELRRHQHEHAPPEPTELRYCVECDRTYKTVGTYLSHLGRMHGPKKSKKKFPCAVCGRVLANKTSYDSHYGLYHLGRTKHQCHLCGKYFYRAEGLQRHMNIHNNVKLPKDKPCDVCGRMFTTKRILQHHMYTHTGERPYKCSHCDAAFTQRYPLMMHLLKIHGVEYRPVRRGRLGQVGEGATDRQTDVYVEEALHHNNTQ